MTKGNSKEIWDDAPVSDFSMKIYFFLIKKIFVKTNFCTKRKR
jgi:hypothetical protein